MQQEEVHAEEAHIRRTRVTTALPGVPERGSTDKHTALPDSLGGRKGLRMQCEMTDQK